MKILNSSFGDGPSVYEWWRSATPGADMVRTMRAICSKQSGERERDLWHARLHGGVDIASLSPSGYARSETPSGVSMTEGGTVGLNIVENICSSAQAEICQNKPKVTYTTDGGSWDLQQKAEMLDRFVEGTFYEVELYDLGPEIFSDAAIFGTGVVKVYEDLDTGRIACERVLKTEMLVDAADGYYGKPRCIYQTKYVDRHVLARLYPDLEEKILTAKTPSIAGTAADTWVYESTADLLQVAEGWHLPSGKGANDGKHVLAVGELTLLEEDWERTSFPFVFFRWLKRPFGFWGKGIPEQIAGIQKEINRLLLKIQLAFKRLGITRVFLERGSKVNPAHLRAHDGDIIEYTGKPPETVAASVIAPEIFTHLWQLERKGYDTTGVSQMTAQGAAPPPGVDSGRAIRTLLANHSKRMSVVGDAYTKFFMDVGKQAVDLARDIARRAHDEAENDAEKADKDEPDGESDFDEPRRKGSYVVRYHTVAGYEEIDFLEVDPQEDALTMRPYPTSALPANPGEKMQTLQEMFNSQVIDKDQYQMLADFPDLKAFAEMNPVLAANKAIMRRLNMVLRDGKAWTPDGNIPFAQAKALAVPFLLNAEMQNAPEGRLDLLRQTIEMIVKIEKDSTAAAAPPAGPPMPGGPAGPGGPPAGVPPQIDPMGPAPSNLTNPLGAAA